MPTSKWEKYVDTCQRIKPAFFNLSNYNSCICFLNFNMYKNRLKYYTCLCKYVLLGADVTYVDYV